MGLTITYDTPMVGYKTAIGRASVMIDEGYTTAWDASLWLAIIFEKTKEQALDDLVAYRSEKAPK